LKTQIAFERHVRASINRTAMRAHSLLGLLHALGLRQKQMKREFGS